MQFQCLDNVWGSYTTNLKDSSLITLLLLCFIMATLQWKICVTICTRVSSKNSNSEAVIAIILLFTSRPVLS